MNGEQSGSAVIREELDWLGYRPTEKMVVYGFAKVVTLDGQEVARKDCSGGCQLPVEKLETLAPGVLDKLVAACKEDRTQHLEMLAKAKADEEARLAAAAAAADAETKTDEVAQ